MRFSLFIDSGNEAMQTYGDVSAALESLAAALVIGGDQVMPLVDGDGARVMDANGNTVGFWKVEDVTP